MEKCKKCDKTLVPGAYFCSYCNSYANDPSLGQKAGLFMRWLASSMDSLIFVFTIVIVLRLGSDINPLISVLIIAIALWILYSQGNTFGHAMLGMKIIKTDGKKVTFGTMFLREFIGKFISLLFSGLGFYWAIWDKDRQAWHDKIAGTVVVQE